MSKKQIRKHLIEEKRLKEEALVTQNEDNFEVKKLAIIFTSILAAVLVIYLITGTFVTGELFKKKATPNDDFVNGETVEIDYTSILASNIFKQAEDSYYVFIYDYEDDTQAGFVSTIQNNYIYASEDLTMYTLDYNDSFNDILADEAISTTKEIKVSGLTLVKVENGELSIFSDNNDDIVEHFISIKE